MKEPTLFDYEPSMEDRISNAKFGGETYDEAKDKIRLTGQLKRVYNVMRDGEWRSLGEIKRQIWLRHQMHDSEGGISARLRDFRKAQFGSHTVDRKREDNGLWLYRLKLSGE